jgi:hypothetical protein
VFLIVGCTLSLVKGSSGLVEQVTTRKGGLSVSARWEELNVQRRIRRMRRVVISSAEAARLELGACGEPWHTVFITLTYRPGVRWAADQCGSYISSLRALAASEGYKIRYQWVLELTKLGTPHYHILVWLPAGRKVPKPDESGMWPHGWSNVQRARKGVGYLVKYATKGGLGFHRIPKGARLFGVGGGGAAEKLAAHRAGLPAWLDAALEPGSRASKVKGLGWRDKDTGEFFKPKYRLGATRDDLGVVSITVVECKSP